MKNNFVKPFYRTFSIHFGLAKWFQRSSNKWANSWICAVENPYRFPCGIRFGTYSESSFNANVLIIHTIHNTLTRKPIHTAVAENFLPDRIIMGSSHRISKYQCWNMCDKRGTNYILSLSTHNGRQPPPKKANLREYLSETESFTFIMKWCTFAINLIIIEN